MSQADGDGTTNPTANANEPTDRPPEPADADVRPEWDDEYIDRVADRLASNYDLERDYRVAGERFPLYGKMELHSQKHFFHPALSFAHHESHEHLYARRVDHVDTATVQDVVALGHDLADDLVEPHEEHYCTEFTFALVAPEVPGDVREQVAGLDERTMLKYGFNGHYEVNVLVVAPEREEIVANEAADVTDAFALWHSLESEEPGLLGLIARRFQL